jgi:peptidoglycan/xylan/chitin deacetylase (PgdA/CDA1 family)
MFDLTLTFDNGPEPETTPFVLDVLARRSIRTTFFVVGNKLSTSQGRELARRSYEEGHWIGNHTWTHSLPLGLLEDPCAIGQEIRETQKAIGVLAHRHRFFRPFGQGGNLDERLLNPLVVDVLSAERMSCVLWNAIPGDWKEPAGWVDRALAQCRAQAWTVMVLHDLPTGAMRNLERFLDVAAELGVRFRQDFAPECVPILDGRIVRPIDHILSPLGIEGESQTLGY